MPGENVLLTDQIQVYDGALSPELCTQIVDKFEADKAGQFQDDTRKAWVEYIITHNRTADWRAIEGQLVNHLRAALTRYADDPVRSLLGLRFSHAFEHLKLKKYCVEAETTHEFEEHIDAFDHRSAVRTVAYLWYLNDVAEGGETVFTKLGVNITPKAGRLLMFPPYWMYQHKGLAPVSNDKYILTSYLNFSDPEFAWRYSYPML